MSRFLDQSSLAVTTVYLSRLEGQADRSWARVAEAIGVKAAGVPRIRVHDLRHTHATLSLQAGVHPKVVSERPGHSTISVTLDTYSHAIHAMEEETAAKVAALVFGS